MLINIIRAAESIKPASVRAYIDKVQVWLRAPMTDADLNRLRDHCGTGGLHVENGPARFDPRYCQRLQLNQPSDEALLLLSRRRDCHLNAVELALDWIFADEESKDEASAFVNAHLVKAHHRDQGIRFVKGVTRYSGPRTAPNVLVTYADRPSKVTGELDCVHVEWRIRGREALKRADISSVSTLIAFNHSAFWLKRLLLYGVHPDALGRRYWNDQKRDRRRRQWVRRGPGSFTYHVDRRTGQTIIRALASTQAVIDELGQALDVRSCLISMRDSHLLPSL